MKKIKTSYLLPLSCVFIAACAEAPATYTVETVDGVRHVKNLSKKWGDKPKIELQFVQQIGDIDAEDEEYIFASPSGVVVDAQQNIYISDFKSHHVQKYSKDGRYLQTIGSKGQGPGEIQNPSYLAIGPENTLYTGWLSNKKLHMFDIDGEYKRTLSLENHVDKLKVLRTSELLVLEPMLIARSPNNKILRILDQDGKFVRDFVDQAESMGWSPPNENNLKVTLDYDDNILVSFLYQNRIEKYSSDGELLMSIKRPKPYVSEISKERKRARDKEGRSVSISMANVFSWGIGTDNIGRIWVLSPKKQLTVASIENNSYLQNYEFEIFSPDGVLLGTIDIEQFRPWGWFEIYGNRLFIYDRVTEVDIKEYKIVDLE